MTFNGAVWVASALEIELLEEAGMITREDYIYARFREHTIHAGLLVRKPRTFT